MSRESECWKMISQNELKEIIHYDPETGIFSYAKDYISENGYKRNKGDVIKSKVGEGYLGVSIFGKQYRLHHLAFLYMLGYMPKEVDHDDGVRFNNKWENLKDCTRSENMKNRKISSYNSTGIIGVHLRKDTLQYSSTITVNGKIIRLGCYPTKNEAAKVRKEAELKYGFNKNHGRKA